MSSGALAQSPLLARRERVWPLVVLSLAGHAAGITFALLHRPPPIVDLEQKPIMAKLVRLGEKRPAQLLPRKEEPPPPPAPAAPAPVPVPVAAPTPPPPPSPAPPAPAAKPAEPKPAAPASGKGDRLSSVLSRIRREQAKAEPVYGDPSGDPAGDSSEASDGDQYLALVERSLRESYVLPNTLSDTDRVGLKATVVLYLNTDGQVLRFAFETHSGNPAFDAALERAIRGARIPPPPPELRKKYRNEGLGVVFRP